MVGSKPEKSKLVNSPTKVGKLTNFFLRKLLILLAFFGFSSNSII